MTDGNDRWERARAVFAATFALDAEGRDRVVSELCPDDEALRDEVRELLKGHDSVGFVDVLADRLALSNCAAIEHSAPRRIGRYEVLEKIGQGGMGLILKAYDARLDRFVAIKVLPPGPDAEPAERRRLLTEARAAAALDHPSIATIFEVDEADDTGVFLVMAFYDGETLADRIRRGPLSPSDACRMAADVADALAAAHARGITHRDLKPANILLTRAGLVKLLDFGVAKIIGVDQTLNGQVLGTAEYMAPEQLRGQSADPRVDVWAVGVVLYEMLTGERPRPPQVQTSDQDEPLLFPDDRPEIPNDLNRIIRRALSLPCHSRYRNGAELRDALTAWLESRALEQRWLSPHKHPV